MGKEFDLNIFEIDDAKILVEQLEEIYHSTSSLITAIEEYHKLNVYIEEE